MAIVRNKKSTPDADQAAAIASFGAAAEARPDDDAPTPRRSRGGQPSQGEPESKAPPKTTLIRWDKHEDLRDALIAYSKSGRYPLQYPLHSVLLEALRHGLDQMTADER